MKNYAFDTVTLAKPVLATGQEPESRLAYPAPLDSSFRWNDKKVAIF